MLFLPCALLPACLTALSAAAMSESSEPSGVTAALTPLVLGASVALLSPFEHAPSQVTSGAARPQSTQVERKRPRPGERRVQILQTLASMLEQPGAERITTAALARQLSVSEAALYRHFASKAQMFEALIEFIESSVFTLLNQVSEREESGQQQARRMATVLLQFGEKNPGMARVMVGDALVFEHERLGQRMNQFFDRVEAQLRQCLRLAGNAAGSATTSADAQWLASGLTALIIGRLQRFARSGFKRSPTEQLEPLLLRLVG